MKYRIIVTNPNSVSEAYEVQSSTDGKNRWDRVYQRSSLSEAQRLYNELVDQHTQTYGYRVIKES